MWCASTLATAFLSLILLRNAPSASTTAEGRGASGAASPLIHGCLSASSAVRRSLGCICSSSVMRLLTESLSETPPASLDFGKRNLPRLIFLKIRSWLSPLNGG